MTSSEYHSLFSSLNDAVEILARHRTSDPEYVVALDTLTQARARIACTIAPAAAGNDVACRTDLVAA
jgi:hypothetical protein